MNLHKFRSLTYLIIALLNIGITIPLVIYFEGLGAAIGTAIAILIGNGFIMNVYYYKKVGIDIPYFWKEIFKIFPALLMPLLLGYLISAFVDIYLLHYFIVSVGVYSIIFIISMWFIGMNNYERSLFTKPLKNIVNILKGK